MTEDIDESEALEEALMALEEAADELRLPERGAIVDKRYQVVSTIGQGGFGRVFEVRHTLLGQRFAMKLLSPTIAADPDWVRRFQEEARATSLMGHENIVFVTDFGQCTTFGYYLVMEYLKGESLAWLLHRQGKMELEEVMRLAVAVSSALGTVHELGIVHCDLKPTNVMVLPRTNQPPAYKVLDFGTSTIVVQSVASDSLYGTPQYMAPEQAAGDEVDHRADQFSLAVMLYELLTGQKPFRTKTWMDAMPNIRAKQKPTPPRFLGASTNEEFDKALFKGMSIDPRNRWPSVEALVEALESHVNVAWLPEADPLDLLESSGSFSRSLTAPNVQMPEQKGADDSMIVYLTDDSEISEPTFRPVVKVVFNNALRLRREYRRNLIAGGLFIPTRELLPVHSQIIVELQYEPMRRGINLEADVVAHQYDAAGSPIGFGVAIPESHRRPLRKFLRSLSLGVGMSQSDIVERVADFELSRKDLSSGEAFIISRLSDPMPVGRIRAMCSGLPFDFEETLVSLAEKGYLVVESSGHSSAVFDEGGPSQRVWQREDTVVDAQPLRFLEDEVDKILELVHFFKEKQNWMGAMEVLDKALSVDKGHARLFHELALIHAEFHSDRARAEEALGKALELDPKDPRIRQTRVEFQQRWKS